MQRRQTGRGRSNRTPGAIDNRQLSTQPEAVDLDTALLRAFVATVEERHFGRAAGRLYLTQQALSKRIQRLEQIVGVPLFERTNRKVALTAAGRRLLPQARQVLDAMDAVAAATGPADAPLRVDVLYEHLAAERLVRAALGADPELRLEVTSRLDRDVVPALRQGDYDLAFGRAHTQPWPKDIPRRLVLLEPLTLLVGQRHPLADRTEVKLSELAGVPLWFPMSSAPPEWTVLLDELRADYPITVDPGGTTGFEDFLDRAAEDRTAATFYGQGMRPLPDPRLRQIPIVSPAPVFAWYAMWRRRVPTALVDRLLAHITLTEGIDLGIADDPDRVWLPAADRAALDEM